MHHGTDACAFLVAIMAIGAAGCGLGSGEVGANGDGADAGGGSADGGAGAAVVEAPRPAPSACEVEPAAGVPVVSMPWGVIEETYLVPGREVMALALDYEVVPRPSVDRVEVRPDFDPAVQLMGGQPAGWEVEQRCPQGLDVARLEGIADDQVIAATVLASDELERGREGRVFLSTGASTLRLEGLPPQIQEEGTDSEGWYVLFEPLHGPSRLLIWPVGRDDVEDDALQLEGVPALSGVVALVQTSALRHEAETGAVYGQQGWASSWRAQALRRWWGGVLRAGQERLELAPLKEQEGPLSWVMYREGLTLEAEDTAWWLLEVDTVELAGGSVALPCGADGEVELWLSAPGFVEARAKVGDQELQVAPGERGPIDLNCGQPGDTTVAVELEASGLTGEPPQLLLELRRQ